MPPPPGVSLRARHWVNLPVVRTVFFHLVWPLQKSLSYKNIQFNKFCLPVKTSCPPAENVKKTHTPPPLPTPVPLTRHHNKYSINHGLQRLTGERLFWLPVPRKSISPYASVCICRVHLSGVHWSPVSSLATFKSCWFLVLPHIHIGFLTWKKGILSNSETYFLFHS